MSTKWDPARADQEAAADLAEAIVQTLGIAKPPVDLFAIIESERKRLAACGEDFGDAFDGRLEYQAPKFLLFYNTKYDALPHSGVRHPRVNFTIAHELGHFFLERHHQYLKRGGKPHGSRTEFVSDNLSEREADSFAANLLMPAFLAEPLLDQGELTLERIERVANQFEASMLSTTFRGVQLSSLPCAVAGLREGRVAWLFPSKQLIEAKCYPQVGEMRSPFAARRWEAFMAGDNERASEDGKLVDWFQTYKRADELADVEVTQATLPVRGLGTLLVLLTMDEEPLLPEEEEEEDEVDREHRERFGW